MGEWPDPLNDLVQSLNLILNDEGLSPSELDFFLSN